MPNKKVARIDIIKAIAGVSFTTLTAIGGSTGHPLLAGLAALPAAGLAAHNTLGDRLAKLKSQKEKYLEIPPPFWWIYDLQNWQNLCAEVENNLPQVLWIMQESMRREEQVMTRDRVREVFIEAFTVQYLASEHDLEQKRRVGEFLAIPILQKLDEVLQPIIEQIQQEGMLIDERRTALHTEQTVRVLEKIHEQVSGTTRPPSLGDEESAVLRRRYYGALYNHWKMLDFKGIMHVDMNRPISIPLTEVFILPDVLPGIPEYETLERETEEFKYGSHARKAKLTPTQREPLPSVLGKHPRLVLLGDPGSGKSTLLRYLLLQLVQGSDAFAATFPELSEIAAIVPLYMPLAAFAEVLLSNAPGTRTLEDFLPIFLHDNYLSAYVKFVQTQLEKGNLFLLFDGLDEIPDASLRMSVVRHIEMFTQSHAANRFIVSSRIVGYKEAPLSSTEYQAYTLADFNEDQVKAFTQRWCPAYERWVNEVWDSQALDHAATKEAEKLFDATQCKPAVKRLAVNPLLLTILALLQRQGIELPSHRVDLFDLCAVTLIDTWVRAKGQKTYFTRNELIKILRPLSFWMHEHPAVGAIPGEEMHEQIVQQLIARSINEYEAAKLAEQFLQTVRGKTGILVERGKERYGFLHLTFEEYFAARELEKRKDRNEFIRKHLHDPRWREVILLTVGAIGILQSNEEEVTELVSDVIRNAGSPYEWALHRDLLFAGLCLGDDVGVRVDRENEIIEQIVYLSLINPYSGLQSAFSSVLATWSGIRVGEKAVALVSPLIHQWVTIPHAHNIFAKTTHLEVKLNEQIERLTIEYQEEMVRYLRFQLTIVLARLLALDRVDWVRNLVGILSEDGAIERALSKFSTRQLSLVDMLLIVLTDPYDQVQNRAISALGYLDGSRSDVMKALLAACSDYSLYIMKTAINAFGHLGERHPGIIKGLIGTLGHFPMASVPAIKVLQQLDERDPNFIDALLIGLVDMDSRETRKLAAMILHQLHNDNDIVDVLIASISGTSSETKEIIAHFLSQFSYSPSNIIPKLLRSFSNTTNFKEVSIRLLGYLGKDYPQTIDILLSALREPNTYIKAAAINALEYLGKERPQIIEALLLTLSDSDFFIRKESILALEKLGKDHPQVVEALLSLLSDPDYRVAEAAASTLGRLDRRELQIIDALNVALDNPYGSVRCAAAHALVQLGRIDPLVLDCLLSSLADTDADIWEAATDSLVLAGKTQPDIVSYLIAALSDTSSSKLLQRTSNNYRQRLYSSYLEKALILLKNVKTGQSQIIDNLFSLLSDHVIHIRIEAAQALGQIGKKDPLILNTLVYSLSHDQSNVRAAAAGAFGQFEKGQPLITNALTSALSDPDHTVREFAADSLGKVGKGFPAVTEVLLEVLCDHGPESGLVHQRAARSLAQLDEGQPQVIDTLLQVLFETSLWGKIGGAYALGKLGKGNKHIMDIILPALSSPDWSVRAMAASTIGYLEDSNHMDALLPLLSDLHWFVRIQATQALGKLGDKLSPSIDALIPSLSNISSADRFATAYVLRNCSGGSELGIKTLFQSLSDTNWDVRGAAAYALAISQNELWDIGLHIEQLLRQYDPIAHREVRDYNFIIEALREVADKTSTFKKSNGSSSLF